MIPDLIIRSSSVREFDPHSCAGDPISVSEHYLEQNF